MGPTAKTINLLGLLIILSGGCSGYQELSQTVAAVSFANETVEGELFVGSQFVATYAFVNSGSENITISSVSPSCTCTNVDWPKGPIAPNGRAQIKLHGTVPKDAVRQLTGSAIVTYCGSSQQAAKAISIPLTFKYTLKKAWDVQNVIQPYFCKDYSQVKAELVISLMDTISIASPKIELPQDVHYNLIESSGNRLVYEISYSSDLAISGKIGHGSIASSCRLPTGAEIPLLSFFSFATPKSDSPVRSQPSVVVLMASSDAATCFGNAKLLSSASPIETVLSIELKSAVSSGVIVEAEVSEDRGISFIARPDSGDSTIERVYAFVRSKLADGGVADCVIPIFIYNSRGVAVSAIPPE